MKKHYILNRPMFNRGGVSAYGKGIASNLVTEEQRQRFNYGGRVRAVEGLDVGGSWSQGLGKDPWGWRKWDPNVFLTPEQIEEKDETQYSTNRERQLGVMDLEDPKDYQGDVIEGEKVVKKVDGTDEVMTDSDWMDLLGPTEEQKRRTKGEAQLNLAAGALDVFSQPTIAKGMKAASPHLSKLAQTVGADQKARDKAILQGKVLEKVYKTKAGEAGKWALKKAYADAGLTGNIETKYNTLIKTMSPDKAIKRLLRAPTNDKLIKGEEGKGEIDFIKFEKMAPGSWTKDETAGIWYVVNKNGKAQPIGKVTDLLVAIEAATK
jgi:hypothetical protein